MLTTNILFEMTKFDASYGLLGNASLYGTNAVIWALNEESVRELMCTMMKSIASYNWWRWSRQIDSFGIDPFWDYVEMFVGGFETDMVFVREYKKTSPPRVVPRYDLHQSFGLDVPGEFWMEVDGLLANEPNEEEGYLVKRAIDLAYCKLLKREPEGKSQEWKELWAQATDRVLREAASDAAEHFNLMNQKKKMNK